MQIKTKYEGAQFEHDDDYHGEVRITRAGVTVAVPIAALRKFVAEAVRADRIAMLRDAKPEDLLRGRA